MCTCTQEPVGAGKGREMPWTTGEVVRTLTWVLGAELQVSARAATAQHHGGIYPAPHSCAPIVTKTAAFYHTDFIYNTMIEGGKAILDAYSIRHGFQEIKI